MPEGLSGDVIEDAKVGLTLAATSSIGMLPWSTR